MLSWNKNWKLIRVELYKLFQKLYKLDPVFITSTIMFSVGCIPPPNILGLRLDCNQFLYRFLLIRKQHLFFKFNRSRWYKRICSKCLSTVDNLQNIRTKFFNIINMLLNMLKYVLRMSILDLYKYYVSDDTWKLPIQEGILSFWHARVHRTTASLWKDGHNLKKWTLFEYDWIKSFFHNANSTSYSCT